MSRPRLLVVGSPSVDLLRFKGRSVRSAGGAGLYTGLAARRAGADVTLVAPRPDPMPPEIQPMVGLFDWVGPATGPEGLPHFEIEYLPNGETVYHAAVRGAEGDLRFDHMPGMPAGTICFVVPLIDPEAQLAFAEHLRDRGLRVACGSYRGGILKRRSVVERVLAASDFFFLNEREAELLFGALDDVRVPAGKAVFITRGARGARVVLGDHAVDIAPVAVEELDPTGAGDTFCGTTLARIAAGDHPVAAARRAAAAAAEMVTGVGPERLLDDAPAPAPPPDPRVRVDTARVEGVAGVIATSPEATAFDFTGPDYPEPSDPGALDFFFAGTLQQFGFWTSSGGRYEAPMIARLDGRDLKGSDFLWAAYRRWQDEAPGELTPAGHADLDRATFDRRLRADDGRNPLPAADHHHREAARYGRDMTGLGRTPAAIVDAAMAADRPLGAFLAALDAVAGYKEDPWRKKSALLAAILAQRPERWLRFGEGEDVPPIVDYHCLRSCLRLGLVEIVDDELRDRIVGRRFVEADEEDAIRAAAFDAVARVRALSGRPMGAVDWFFFQNRRRCPEMSEPECGVCPAEAVCAQRKALFQPVLRTTAY